MRQRHDGTGKEGVISNFDVVTSVDTMQNKNITEENQPINYSLENDAWSSNYGRKSNFSRKWVCANCTDAIWSV